jgi:penicillin-binding protein 1A
VEARIYSECERYYPFVLGAQPVRPVDLAAFYAATANEGQRPSPYVVESIERNRETVFRHDRTLLTINSVDRAAFYQLKTMMQCVLARGTARSITAFSPYVAGKTGTSDDENDAWFLGFTNDVTVAVWLGYDNADGKRRTLGGGSTGGGVAVPIFEPVIQAVWAHVAPKARLAPPSPEAKRQLACKSTDLESRAGQERHYRMLPIERERRNS